jgi:hypothetical protein
MIYAIILYETLHKYMGQNLSNEETHFSFGSQDKNEEFVAPPNLDDLRTYGTIPMKSNLIMNHHLLKK